jgi:uncharacterized protein YjhX (UPF0386 family)
LDARSPKEEDVAQRVTWHLAQLGQVHTVKQDEDVLEFVDALHRLGFDPEVTPC